ncbi:hypothetical protein L2E82_36632 [Cichorium intybus]|uniref:Uncharacterized protein n=1 Tax=Cichorium intybus TaxID=13427 RepID=A0ACB9ACW1_CICIN|nr:hypothetical protein L2E82_36632 [Cichorium intybus]
MDRCPEAHFISKDSCFPQDHEIKSIYEGMKAKVQNYVATGNDEKLADMFDAKFTREDHPTVIQVLLDNSVDVDVSGHAMPNLIYVSREKRKAIPHNFKAGALNVLLRVSETMTNAPIILTVDCDMYSNDPKTPLEALCYFLDPSTSSDIAYLQCPQIFHGTNRDDLYGAEIKFVFQINMAGLDGMLGPIHVGTGCFFQRRAFYGGPSSDIKSSIPSQSIQSSQVLTQAHEVAGCNYETQTEWGNELGYRYGSLVEDFYTGYRLQCQGWRSVFHFPKRPAFLGNAPMNLHDLLNQTQRWSIGLLDVAFCKFNPFTTGLKVLPFFQTLCYIHYISWPIWCIPVTIYAILPQLALIRGFTIFPKVFDPWFLLHCFLFIGAYCQDFLEFKLGGGTTRGWYNNQRAWIVRSVSSYTFAVMEYTLTKLQVSTSGFNVTSKVVDEERRRMYEKGMMEFGLESPFFYPLSVAGLVNLVAFIYGVVQLIKYGGLEDLFVQFFLAGFGVVNSWPVYEAMVLRSDHAKMPLKITVMSIGLTSIICLAAPLVFQIDVTK